MDAQKTQPLSLASTRQLESTIMSAHRNERNEVIALSDELLGVLYAGLSLTINPKQRQADLVINGMLAAALNAYLKTADLIIEGYYALALNNMRLLAEYWIAALYADKEPTKAWKWFEQDRQAPSFKSMIPSVFEDESRQEIPATLRHFLNRFARATPITLVHSIVQGPEGKTMYRVGPSLDLRKFDFLMSLTLQLGAQLLNVVSFQGGVHNDEWFTTAETTGHTLKTWLDATTARYASDPVWNPQ